MVSPAASAAKEVSSSTAERSWREAAEAAVAAESAGSSQPARGAPQLQFDVAYVQSNAEACKAIHRALTELR